MMFMDRTTLSIVSNTPISGSVYEMTLSGCRDAQRPGQFVDIALPGLFLRRPISVCDWADGVLTLAYKVVGKGTAQMAAMQAGETLDVLTSLGNGFDLEADCAAPLLVGGGIGAAPLLMLCKALLAKGKTPAVILGFNKADEVILADRFEQLGVKVLITTVDGSAGVKGFVTDALPLAQFDYWYACGPMPMLRALVGAVTTPGEASLEERMGCGTGICMGCTCHTASGPKRICKDGPVFKLDQLQF